MVTGATSGIGHACAEKFLNAGYKVIVTARREAKLKELFGHYGDDCKILCFDVCDRDAALSAVASLPEEWSRVDVLINNAGLALGLEPEYEGNSGHVINIGSVAGDAAYANGNVYCATKAAVKSLTDGLRIDVAKTAVRVTLLKPGLVETNFSNVRFHGDDDRAAQVYKGIVPLTGEDIADAALYAAQAPAHVQIAEMLILATHQASGSVIVRE